MAALVQQNERLQQQVCALEAQNKLLREKVNLLLKRLFGASSEKISQEQLQTAMAGFPPRPPVPAPPPPGLLEKDSSIKSPPAKRGRRCLPKSLETERIVLEPEEVKAAPQNWKKIGEEITEELDYRPGRFLRRLYIRPKYVPVAQAKASEAPSQSSPSDVVTQVLAEREEGKQVRIAPLAERLIEKGYPGPGLMAYIVISKYEDHLPLYRQEKIYRQRHGLHLPRQSLAQWVEQAAFWLKPIYEEIKAGLQRASYLQADETPIHYLDPDRPGKAQWGYLWSYSLPGSDVLFDWQTIRSHEAPAQVLKSFKGDLQTDAYAAYGCLAKERQGEIQLVGCWAHCRRKFVEAIKEDPRVGWFVRQIGHLYRVERKARETRAGPKLRAALRSAEAGMVLNRLHQALQRLAGKVLPSSGFGEAMAHALKHWATLVRYVENGRLEIDNNLIENAIRPTAIGKKNFLFIGHPGAGWYSAVIYSLLGSCRRHGVNPHEYLSDVLSRLPSATNHQIAQLTPAAWAKAKRAQARAAQP